MTILVTGADGTVGSAFRELAPATGQVFDWADLDLDITDLDGLLRRFEARRYSAVVNLAAATDVDRCEREPTFAYRLNTLGAWNVALAAQRFDAVMVQVSTTAVFGGDGALGPFSELDRPVPPNIYARTKLAGEELVRSLVPRSFIIRTAWVMGGGAQDKKFVGKVAERMRRGEPIRAVDDEWGSPTYALDLARAILELLGQKAYGLYHVTNLGRASRLDMVYEMKRILRSSSEVTGVPGSTFSLDAPRPKSDVSESFALPTRGITMRTWEAALADYLGTFA